MPVFQLKIAVSLIEATTPEEAVTFLTAKVQPDDMEIAGYAHENDSQIGESMVRSPIYACILDDNKLRPFGPIPAGYRCEVIGSNEIVILPGSSYPGDEEDRLDMEEFGRSEFPPIDKLLPRQPALFVAVPEDSTYRSSGWNGNYSVSHVRGCPRTSLRVALELSQRAPVNSLIWWNNNWMDRASACAAIQQALEDKRVRQRITPDSIGG